MPGNYVILISGPPCTGKTNLGKRIAESMRIPFINKDEIKESLFEGLGSKDRDWSKKLGGISFDLFYLLFDKMLGFDKPFVAETDFSNPKLANQHFRGLQSRYSFKVIQLNLVTSGEILLERFVARSNSGERHPGHVDSGNVEEFKETLLLGKREPVEVLGKTIEIDTTDFSFVDFNKILKDIQQFSSENGRN